MQMKRVCLLVQIAPIVMSVMGLATVSVCAAEVPASTESDRSTVIPELISTESIALSPHSQTAQAAPITLEETDLETGVKPLLRSSEVTISIFAETEDNKIENDRLNETITPNSIQSSLELEHLISNREDLDETQLTQFLVSDMSGEAIMNISSSETMQLTSIAPSELERLTFSRWQMAQAETSPERDIPEDASATDPDPEETTSSPPWHVTFTPYGFIPLSVDGSATVRDFTADFNLGLDDILNPLNFAAAGRVEAWKGNLGFIFDGAYFNVGQENSISRSIPDCLCGIFPSEIETDVNVQYGQFDLGIGYRVAANLSNAATEFEMGPLVFDAIVGMRIYAFQQEIDISTNVGTDRNLENSNTIVTPLVSSRLRWNLSPRLAGWVRGDIAGFGIGGTLMAASVTGGVDWMFSGNTSLLLAYRISSLQYTTDIRGEDFALDLLMQGPYMGIVFRF